MKVLIRGAGDIATGIALRLHRSGLNVIMTDLEKPTSIRRTVCFSEAIRFGRVKVEDIEAVYCSDPSGMDTLLEQGKIPVFIDPDCRLKEEIHPDVIVDAILAKQNLGTGMDDAPVVIGVGPGFEAGKDCHAVVETMRGHTLGRVIYQGCAIPNTDIPGTIGGFSSERILRAPDDGVFHQNHEIGDMITAGEICGYVNGKPMCSAIDGVIRGLLAEGTVVCKGMKSGDVDPRGKAEYCDTASDKAIAVGGGVLEAILHLTQVLKK